MSIAFLQGSYRVHVARLNVDGEAVGQLTTPNNPVNGTAYPAYMVEHPVSIASQTVPRTDATDIGGQRVRGKKDLGASGFDSVELVLSDYDMGFDAVVTGSVVNTTSWASATIGGANHTNPALPQVALWFTGGAQIDGVDQYRIFLGVGTVSANDVGTSQNGGVNPNPSTYTFTPTTFSVLPNGITLASLSLGYDENVRFTMLVPEQMDFFTYVADAAETSFTLPYLPLYDDVDGTTNNIITLNGATGTPSAINTSTGAVTIASATAGDVWQVWYPTAFTASA